MRPTDNLLTFPVEAAGVIRGSTLSSTTTILPDLLSLAVVLGLLVNEQVPHLTSCPKKTGPPQFRMKFDVNPAP